MTMQETSWDVFKRTALKDPACVLIHGKSGYFFKQMHKTLESHRSWPSLLKGYALALVLMAAIYLLLNTRNLQTRISFDGYMLLVGGLFVIYVALDVVLLKTRGVKDGILSLRAGLAGQPLYSIHLQYGETSMGPFELAGSGSDSGGEYIKTRFTLGSLKIYASKSDVLRAMKAVSQTAVNRTPS